MTSLADLCAPAPEAAGPGEHAPAHANNARRGRVTPSATGLHDVRLSITGEEHEDFCAAQALLGHAVPSGDPAEIYARAMKFYRAHLEKQRLGCKPGAAVRAARTGSRHVPKQLRRLVWERDGGRCAYVSADGHRCEETLRLELDHITPLAKGGVALADATPEASLEACLRRVLPELARPVALRGERMARSTA